MSSNGKRRSDGSTTRSGGILLALLFLTACSQATSDGPRFTLNHYTKPEQERARQELLTLPRDSVVERMVKELSRLRDAIRSCCLRETGTD